MESYETPVCHNQRRLLGFRSCCRRTIESKHSICVVSDWTLATRRQIWMGFDMSIHVARDPFARGSYHRESTGSGKCWWCGQRKTQLFEYFWERDAGRCPPVEKFGGPRFCNFECFDAYHTWPWVRSSKSTAIIVDRLRCHQTAWRFFQAKNQCIWSSATARDWSISQQTPK